MATEKISRGSDFPLILLWMSSVPQNKYFIIWGFWEIFSYIVRKNPARKGVWYFIFQADTCLLTNTSLYFQALPKYKALFYPHLQGEFQRLFAEGCSCARLTKHLPCADFPGKTYGLAISAEKVHLLGLSSLCQTLAAHLSRFYKEVSW